MHKPIFLKTLSLSLLILVFLILALYVSKSKEQKAETILINPTQVQSYENNTYFLDFDTSQNDLQSIKKYENGKIYNATPWVSKDFLEKQQILGFDVVSPNKFIILIERRPEQVVRRAQDVPEKNVYSVYMLDGNLRKVSKITSVTRTKTNGFIQGMHGQVFLDSDKEGNVYLPFSKEIIKITPEGKSEVFPPSTIKDAIGFGQVSVSPHGIFAILKNTIIETDKNGKFVKYHDIFKKGSIGLVKSYDNVIFVRHYNDLSVALHKNL